MIGVGVIPGHRILNAGGVGTLYLTYRMHRSVGGVGSPAQKLRPSEVTSEDLHGLTKCGVGVDAAAWPTVIVGATVGVRVGVFVGAVVDVRVGVAVCALAADATSSATNATNQ